jgi:hypothetical protein
MLSGSVGNSLWEISRRKKARIEDFSPFRILKAGSADPELHVLIIARPAGLPSLLVGLSR